MRLYDQDIFLCLVLSGFVCIIVTLAKSETTFLPDKIYSRDVGG